MAITVPVVNTPLSVSTFGKPVADQLNALAPTAWTNVTFTNGWTNTSGAQACQYRKEGDIVRIRGRMTPGTMGQIAFTLPAGFRPPAMFDFSTAVISGGQWAWGFCYIDPSGGLYALNPASPTAVSVNVNFSITA